MTNITNGTANQTNINQATAQFIQNGINGVAQLKNRILNSRFRNIYSAQLRAIDSATTRLTQSRSRLGWSTTNHNTYRDPLGLPFRVDGTVTVVISDQVHNGNISQSTGWATYNARYNQIVIHPVFAEALRTGRVQYWSSSSQRWATYTIEDLIHHEFGHAGDPLNSSGGMTRDTALKVQNTQFDLVAEQFERFGQLVDGRPVHDPHGVYAQGQAQRLRFLDENGVPYNDYENVMDGYRAFRDWQRAIMNNPGLEVVEFIEEPPSVAEVIGSALNDLLEGVLAGLGTVDEIDGGQLGIALGSVLGGQISDNPFVQIVASGTLSTVLGAIGEYVDENVFGGVSSTNLLDAGAAGLGEALLQNIKGAGIGALSSYLTAQLVDAVGLDGIPGELAGSVGGTVLTQILNNIPRLGQVILDAAGNPVIKNGVIQRYELFTEVGPTLLVSTIASYLGNELADLIHTPENVGGQIGSAVGAAYGSWVATTILASGLNPVTIVAAIVAVAVWKLIGGLVGSVFGGTPRSGADAAWDETKSEFVVANVYARKGGSKDAAISLASAVAANFNAIIAATGSTLIDPQSVQTGNYGMRQQTYVYRPYSTTNKDAITARFKGENGAAQLVAHGTYLGLNDMVGQLAGGDIYAKRALAAALHNAGGDPNSNSAGAAGSFDMETLLGDITIALDYANYRANSIAINALVAAHPQSEFSASWVVTLSRAIELGLNRRGATDWNGGYETFLDGILDGELGGDTLSPALLVMGIDPITGARYWSVEDVSGEFVGFIEDTVEAGSQTTIEGNDLGEVITLIHSDTLIDGTEVIGGVDYLADTTDLEINGLGSNGPISINVTATIDAGGGDDTVHAGDMGNNVLGGTGNDSIYGGRLDDWLLGGEGSDHIYAGDQAGHLGGDGNYLDGGEGQDFLYGREGSDWLEGGDGVDTVDGGGGDDVLTGGAGEADVLKGGSGDDQYLLRAGDGADGADETSTQTVVNATGGPVDARDRVQAMRTAPWLRNWFGDELDIEQAEESNAAPNSSGTYVAAAAAGGEDAVVFGLGIDIGDIRLKRSGAAGDGSDLIIDVMHTDAAGIESESGTRLTLKDWFSDPFKRVEWLKFADGNEIRIGDTQTFIIGTAGDDILNGTAGNDFVYGAEGDDQIKLYEGDDIGNGATGDDVIWGDQDDDLLVGGLGRDKMFGGDDQDMLSGDAEDDELMGEGGDDTLSGGRGDDTIAGGAGTDTIRFSRGDGRDKIVATAAETEATSGQWVTVWDDGWLNGITINEAVGMDWGGRIRFNRIDNRLEYFDGLTIAATPTGSRDTIEFDLGIDIQDLVLSKVGTNLVIGVAGENAEFSSVASLTDSLTLEGWYNSSAAGDWSTNRPVGKFVFYQIGELDLVGEGWTLIGGSDAADGTTTTALAGTAGKDWITGGAGDDVVAGGAGDDVLHGNGAADELRGEAGTDVLYGGSGDDVLDGGAGGDLLSGGDGLDAASFASAAGGVAVNLGDDRFNSGDAKGDQLHGIENLIGSAAGDRLAGDDGENELTGGGGSDALLGGEGDDTYIWRRGDGVDAIGEGAHVMEDAISASGTLTAGIALEWVPGATPIWVPDPNLPPQLEPFYPDTNGGQGYWEINYTLQLWQDGELIYSADGYIVPDGQQPVASYADHGWVAGYARTGTGSQVSRIAADPAADGGSDTLEFGEGISLADLAFARVGDDLVVTVSGDQGGTIRIRSHYATGGRIEFVQFNDGFAASLAQLLIADAATPSVTGGEGDDLIVGGAEANSLAGGAGDDVLSGDGGIDTLHGGAGDDTLEGGAGADVLDGGANTPIGDDTKAGDTVRYASSGAVAVDLRVALQSGDAASHAGGDTLTGIENVVGSLAGGDAITGNDEGNRLFGLGGGDNLTGHGGDDVLDGGAGDDTLDGGLGDDNLVGGDGVDALTGGDGLDTLEGGAGNDNLSGGAGKDMLGGGDGGDLLDGGADDDSLVGGAHGDHLIGGAGADTLAGGAGDDILQGGAGDDIYAYSYRLDGDIGVDWIADSEGKNSIVFADGVSIDQLWFSQVNNAAGQNWDLRIGIIGTDDVVTVASYFAPSNPARLHSVVTASHTLYMSTAAPLIAAMTATPLAQGKLQPDAMTAAIGELLPTYWHEGFNAAPDAVQVAGGGQLAVSEAAKVPVAIANRAGLSVTETSPGVYQLQKPAATGAWDASATSSTAVQGDFVLRGRGIGDANAVLGLTSDPLTNNSWNSIDYGIQIEFNNQVVVVENGAYKYVGARNDQVWIWRTGTTLKYGTGPDFATASTSGVIRTVENVSAALYFDSSTFYAATVEAELTQLFVADGTVVGQVTALDGDGDALTFSLVPIAGSVAHEAFAISSDGVITVRDHRLLDHETTASYTLRVQVSDGQSATTTDVTVSVADVNEAPGTVQVVGGGQLSVSESAPAPVAIASSGSVAVTDLGHGSYAFRKVTASEGWDASATSSAPVLGDFVLRVRRDDPGENGMIGMTSDPGASAGFDTMDFAIWIQPDGFSYVYENGSFVAQTSRNDQDWIWRTGTTLHYGTGPDFATASTTGRYRTVENVAGPLHFDSSFYSTATIEAQLTQPAVGNGAVVGQVIAPDPDGDALSFSLVPVAGSVAHEAFAISSDGIITVRDWRLLDREAAAGYVLRVQVSDGQLSTTTDVTVSVADVNEAPTGIDMPDPVAVIERDRVVPGTLLGAIELADVTVLDPDFASLPTGSYDFIVSDSRFEIVGGKLYLKAGEAFDHESVTSLSLTVTATDRTTTPFSVVRTMTVNIDNADDVLVGSELDDSLTGQTNRDIISGDGGNDTISGAAGNDDLFGNAGDDYLQGQAGDDLASGDAGADQLFGGPGADRLYGGDDADVLQGGADNDSLHGENGNDRLDGGLGADTMSGGSGDDVYVVDDAADAVIEDGDQGVDKVETALASHSLAANVENLTYIGTGTSAFTGTGNTLANVIVGGAGNDMLSGGAGDDTLDGGAGDDALAGSVGQDIYHVDSIGDQVVENAGEGIDEVRTDLATYTLAANVEKLTASSGATHKWTDNALDNVITGGAGVDIIVLRNGGVDSAFGGAGDDGILLGGIQLSAGSLLDGGSGTDQLGLQGDYSAGITLGTNLVGFECIVLLPGFNKSFGDAGGNFYSYNVTTVDQLVAAGPQFIVNFASQRVGEDVTFNGSAETDGRFKFLGGAGNDNLTGGAGADEFFAQGGTDIVFGGAGNDMIDGGDGDDELRGQDGADTIYGRAGNDGLFGGPGTDTLWGGSGDDSLSGGADSDTLNGEAGIDRLDGGVGADTMAGGTENDIYVVDDAADTVIENVGEGVDTVETALASHTLAANVENLTFTYSGTGGFTGTGNALANVITGGAGADTLRGLGGDDTLTGGAGDDTLEGGDDNDTIYAGDDGDTLIGGAGSDTMYGGNGSDTYIVNRSTGADTIHNFDDGVGTDELAFEADVTREELWFERVDANGVPSATGADMRISVIGTLSSVTVKDWAQGELYRINIVSTTGHFTHDLDIDALAALMRTKTKPTNATELAAVLADSDYRDQWATKWNVNQRPAVAAVPNQQMYEDGTLTVTINISDDITYGGSLTLTPTITSGASLIQGVTQQTVSSTGSSSVRTITITPAAHKSGSATFRLTARDASGNISEERDFSLNIIGVPDAAAMAFAPPVAVMGQAGGISLGLTVTFPDTDGSEVQAVTIAGVPAGATLSAGTYDSGAGLWRLTPAQIAGLKVNVPAGRFEDFSLTATATATEAGSTATTVRTATVVINAPPTGANARGLGTAATPSIAENPATTGIVVGAVNPIDPDTLDRNLVSTDFNLLPRQNEGEERIVTATGPAGTAVQVMETGQITSKGSAYGGGIYAAPATGVVDKTKLYKYTVYVKPENNVGHMLYFGTFGDVQNLNGTSNTNPYFWYGYSAGLVQDRWYKIEGYILPAGSADIGYETLGGVYDTVTGAKVADTTTFRWGPNASDTYTRFFSYYYDGVEGYSAQWYQPTIEKLEYAYEMVNPAPGQPQVSTDGRFTIDRVTGIIKTNSTAFNYEATASHNVTVRIIDGTTTYDKVVAVGVTNVNETPNLPSGPALVFFTETGLGANPANGNVVVATFSLTDPDGTTPAMEWVNNYGGWYNITGNQVRFNTGLNFNFEEFKNAGYTVGDFNGNGIQDVYISNNNVRANDGQLASADVLFQVFIEDVNEQIVVSAPPMSVSENVAAGTVVGTVTATDPDDPAYAYGQKLFYFSNGGAVSLTSADGRFAINNTTGVVTTLVALDREATPILNYTVIARDNGGAAGYTQSTAGLTISVSNVNEAPNVPGGPQHVYFDETGLGSNPANGNVVVASYALTDPDGTVPALQLANNYYGWYHVAGNQVRFNNTGLNFDFESFKNSGYTVGDFDGDGRREVFVSNNVVQASDGQLNSGQQILYVYIHDINEQVSVSAPVMSVGENLGAGTVVGTVTATDPDDPAYAYGQKSFYFSNGGTASSTSVDGRFAINAATGVVTTLVALDYEATPSLNYTVMARDNGGAVGYTQSTAGLTINVGNANDVAPTFTVTPTTFTVAENTAGGTVVSNGIRATDPDGFAISYSIDAASNPNGAFGINASGQVVIAAGVDYEAANWLSDASGKYANLVLRASDGVASITQTVQVRITNVVKQVMNSGWGLSPGYSWNNASYESGFGDPYSGWDPYSWISESTLTHNASGGVVLYDMAYGPQQFTTYRPVPDPAYAQLSEGYRWTGNGMELVTDYEDSPFYPLVLDLAGNGLDNAFGSAVGFDLNGNGYRSEIAWINAGYGFLALDDNNDGAITNGLEISFTRFKPGAETDLEGLQAFDSNQDGQISAADARFADFRIWQDANRDGVSQPGELAGLAELGIVSLSLTGTATGRTLSNSAGNVIVNTAAFTRADGTTGQVGDAVLRVAGEVLIDDPTATTMAAAAEAAPPPLAAFVLDYDGDGAGLVGLAASSATLDVDGDGVADKVDWFERGDALLAIDRNADGRIDRAAEISFLADKPGATGNLAALSAFDGNGDGRISTADADYARFRLWFDHDGNGATDAGELLSLAQAGVSSITLGGTSGSFTLIDGRTGGALDAALAWEKGVAPADPVDPAEDLEDDGTGEDDPAETEPARKLEFDRIDLDRRVGRYRLAAGEGRLQMSLGQAEGVVDPRAGRVGPASIVTFRDRQVGMLSAVVLDLDGDGVELRGRGDSRARFDMDGDGSRDDTGWIGKGDGFLVIDADGNGAIEGAAELALLAEKPDARSSLDALAVLDSNKDGIVDASDKRFGELKVWADRNRNGVTDANELSSLADLGIASINLSASGTEQKGRPGRNMIVATASFTRSDGSVSSVGDVSLAFRPSGSAVLASSALPGELAELGASLRESLDLWHSPREFPRPLGADRTATSDDEESDAAGPAAAMAALAADETTDPADAVLAERLRALQAGLNGSGLGRFAGWNRLSSPDELVPFDFDAEQDASGPTFAYRRQDLPGELLAVEADGSAFDGAETGQKLAQMIQHMAAFAPRGGESEWRERGQAVNQPYDYFAG